MKKYILKSMSLLCGAILVAGCTGSFDDVNKDPDNPLPSETSSTNILAYCERFAGDRMFDEWFDINETCGFAGHIAKMQYPEEGYYNFRRSVNSSSWERTDYVVANLKTILDKETSTDAAGNKVYSNMWAVATIFQCQIWQIMCDRWGNMPYWTTTGNPNLKSQALQLEDGYATPEYDKQQYIYPDLLDRLEQAVDILESGVYEDEIGDGDGLLGADINQWIKYANALRLRIAARIANIRPDLAKSTFEAVVADGKYPTSNNDNVFFTWNNEYAEPWADYYQTRHNEYAVSALMVSTLKNASDPRLSVYAAQAADYAGEMETKDELNRFKAHCKSQGFVYDSEAEKWVPDSTGYIRVPTDECPSASYDNVYNWLADSLLAYPSATNPAYQSVTASDYETEANTYRNFLLNGGYSDEYSQQDGDLYEKMYSAIEVNISAVNLCDPQAYRGYQHGQRSAAVVKYYSRIGQRFQHKSDVKGFTPWLRSCETSFALAYLAHNLQYKPSTASQASAEDYAKAMYEQAVNLSLEENEVNTSYLSQVPYSEDNLFTQWWISLFKNGQEAWSVYRMAPTTSALFKMNRIAVGSYWGRYSLATPNGHNCPPMCYGYPDTERNLNSTNCAAESAAEVDYFWGKKMWWDVREDLH